MSDIKILATVQHTGTWFMKNVLEDAYGQQVTLYDETFKVGEPQGNVDSGWAHMHFGISNEYKPHSKHFNGLLNNMPEEHVPKYILDALVEKYQTVISVRDPLLSILTREIRMIRLQDNLQISHKGRSLANHKHIINGFKMLAEYSSNPNVFLFPIDLPCIEKHSLMRQLEMFADIKPVNHKCKQSVLKNWKPENSSNGWISSNNTIVDIKNNYQNDNNNYNAVIDWLPEETTMLFNNPEIKNMLQGIGYNLPWFSACI